MAKIFIIIPVFNRIELTLRCISSIQEQTYLNYQIIIVDHGSTDGTSEIIDATFPNVTIVKGHNSQWWAAATNLGIKYVQNISHSSNDFILTLNNDLEVSENYLQELLNSYFLNTPCIVGSTSLDINNNDFLSFCGIKWNRYTAKFKDIANTFAHSYQLLREHKNEYIESDMLPGRGTLIPITLFNVIGWFDEKNFPHYMADLDFSLRSAKVGYKCIVSTKAVLFSHIEATGINISDIKPILKKLNTLFFSMKSPNNIKARFNWARKHSPIGILYFNLDLVRVIFSKIIFGKK